MKESEKRGKEVKKGREKERLKRNKKLKGRGLWEGIE